MQPREPIQPKNLLTPLDKCLDKLDRSLDQVRSRKALDDVHRRERMLLLTMKALLDSRDVPTWLKSVSGHMLYVNPAYAGRFGVTVEEYGGRTDDKVWPAATAEAFQANDLLALKAAGAVVVEEEVNGEMLTVRKWPVYFSGQLVGVAGEIT